MEYIFEKKSHLSFKIVQSINERKSLLLTVSGLLGCVIYVHKILKIKMN